MAFLAVHLASETVFHFAGKLARNLFNTLVDEFLVALKLDSAFKLDHTLRLVAATSLFVAAMGLGFCLCKVGRT
jgi:hypothetical protein